MKSRPARLTLSALAWIALGAVAFFTFHTQQQIDQRRTSLRTFESTARDAADALDDAQAGQQAYVVPGQDARDWMAKVATFLQTASSSIDTLRSTAQSQVAGPALLDASTAMTQVGNVDRRVREHLAADQIQPAADAIFAEAGDAISSAVSNIDTAIVGEQQAADEFEADRRRAQVYALGGAAGFVAFILVVLAIARPDPATAAPGTGTESASTADAFGTLAHDTMVDRTPIAPAHSAPAPLAAAGDRALTAAANICTGFGRVRDVSDVKQLLEQAADVMQARGMIVWLGGTDGADLRPVLAHGYSDATLARIATVPRSADNAAAAAYRSGEVQIVKSKPGAAQGAIVAPLLASEGCIGAFTAEIRDGAEESEATRALSLIVAAQLAGVLAPAAEAASAQVQEPKSAAG